MVTYQDLLLAGNTDKERAEFVQRVIQDHEGSDLYKTAKIADDYARSRNTTIMNYQKIITTVTGQQVVDRFSPVHRSTSNFFKIFVTQLSQYLLGNGVSWEHENTAGRFGGDFDTRLQELTKAALRGGVSFGFFNYDHIEVFPVYNKKKGNFAPLFDEENGGLGAGVRYWRIDSTKPQRATLYEMDGYTEFMWSNDSRNVPDAWDIVDNGVYTKHKQPYKIRVRSSVADGVEVKIGENYPAFPIVPLYGNPEQESEIIGLREKIDAYDMILNGFENDLDNAQIYWIIRGAGGMDDPDLMRFLDRLRTVKAAAPEEGQEVSPVEVNIPYEARERLLDRLERQLYKDAMIMDPYSLAGSAATATQIKAAYTPQNNKADELEYCVLDFMNSLFRVAGVEGESVSFTRSMIVNTQEEVTTVVSAATYLDQEYVTTKVLELMGDGDKAQEVLRRMDAESMERLGGADNENVPSGPEGGIRGGSDVEGV